MPSSTENDFPQTNCLLLWGILRNSFPICWASLLCIQAQPPDQTSAHLSFLIHGSFCRSDLVIISFLLVFNFMLRSILIFLIPCRSSLSRPTPYQWIIFVFLAATSASVEWCWWVQISFRQANTVIEQTRPVGCEYLSATWIMSKIYIYYISLHQSIW